MKLFPILILGVMVLNSCEGELDNLGSQFVNESEAHEKAYALLAYNINNNDSIRADASKLDSVRIGAFRESVFGGQKVSYITQLRLNNYNPDFGKNPVLDSVVLSLKPRYQTASDSATTTTNEDYIYPDGQIAAKKVVVTYPVAKYGRAKIGTEKTKFTIKVNEVNDFLGGTTDKLYSNQAVSLGTQIGSKVFDGTINSVTITKDSDASEIVKRTASFRMNLDNTFFQNKIIAKQGNQALKDAASFIRYFKGISISVAEDEGYLFSMAPNDVTITMYYKNDVTAADGTVTKTKQETSFNLGVSNVHLSKITYDRTSYYNGIMSPAGSPNNVTGDDLILAQGMGGASFGVKIPLTTIQQLRDKYKNDKVAIVSAKIRLYNDDSWNNKYRKPTSMLVKEKDSLKRFLPDMTELSAAGYSLIKPVNLTTKDAYYDIGITSSLKKIIENESSYDAVKNNGKDFIINLGSYLVNSSTGNLLGQNYNDRTYNPFRIVLKGTDKSKTGQEISNSSKNTQLRIIYTQK